MRILMIAVALFSMFTADVAQACGSHGCGGARGGFAFSFNLQISSGRSYGGGCGGYGGCGHRGYGHGGYHGGYYGRRWFGAGRMAHRRAHRLYGRGAYHRGNWAMNRANRRASRWM